MAQSDWWQTETNDEVATSPELWRPLSDAIGGFDLDPAAGCEPQQIADERFTPKTDGLSQSWFGNVWLNPPFSEPKKWYRKLVNEFWNGDVDRAIALAKVDPSTEWFHQWFSTADEICYLNGRNWYLANGDSPSFSTMVGAWNPTEQVTSTFLTLGTVVEPKTERPTQLTEF